MFRWMKKFIVAEQLRGEKEGEMEPSSSGCRRTPFVSALDRKQWLAIVHVQEQAIKVLCHNIGAIDEEVCASLEELFKSTPHIAETINLSDPTGMNLLQYAIKSDLPLTCSFLIKQGADLNSPGCNRPLHLAAKLGNSHLMELLLDYGSDPDCVASVCFPEDHVDKSTSLYNPQTMTWTPACSTNSRKHTDYPLYFAIMSNQVQCLKSLIDRGHVNTNRIPPLHVACREGKYNAVHYLITQNRDSVTQTDPAGYLPIQYAVKWGREFLQLLVQSGSTVMALTKRRETLLHLLFQDVNSVTGLSACVEYLLNCGLNMNINVVDDSGNSALMLLLKNMPELLKKENKRSEENIYWEVIASARLLLQARCNPNICNLSGDRALHILLTSPCPLIVMHELLHLLLSNRANPNFSNATNERPLWLLCKTGYNTIFSTSWQALTEGRSTCTDLLVECIRLLHQYKGGESSVSRSVGGTTHESLFRLLFTHVLNIRQLDGVSQDHNIAYMVSKRYMDCISEITQALLETGYTPTSQKGVTSRPEYSSDLSYLFYCLITQSKFIPYKVTVDLLTLMLRHGADPDVGGVTAPLSSVPNPVQRPSNRAPVYPLLHLLHVYWKSVANASSNGDTDQLSCYEPSQIMQLFHLFYSVSSHDISSACLKSFLYGDIPNLLKLPDGAMNQQRSAFLEQLKQLLCTTATLQHICAVKLYLHLDRKADKFNQLPLPTAVKQRLLKFEFQRY